MNVYSTPPGSPLVAGYTTVTADVTALLQAHIGQTLRLRFAEVDNISIFNMGVDAVSLEDGASQIPEPSTWTTSAAALVLCLVRLRGSIGRRANRARVRPLH